MPLKPVISISDTTFGNKGSVISAQPQGGGLAFQKAGRAAEVFKLPFFKIRRSWSPGLSWEDGDRTDGIKKDLAEKKSLQGLRGSCNRLLTCG